jgi:predicted phage terminase large subunit-like protein
MSLSAQALKPSRFRPELLAVNLGSRSSLLMDSPSIAGLSSTVSYDSSRLSSQTTSQRLSSRPPLTFREFIEPAWQVVEPSTRFIGGYHVDAIAEHLQAVSDGQLQNLIINIPPRHTKSTFVGVLWPAWEWTINPWLQWLCASYRESLAIRDGVRMRRLVASGWYQERWGGLFRMTGDQNEKRRFENDQAGYRVSVGVGTGTGEGGHRLVLDDPISADQAESDAYRLAANDWIDGTFSTRGNDPRTVARVVVMQRLHEADTTGHLLDKMAQGGTQFDHLVLPAEYEPTVQVCLSARPLMHDPRTEPGRPLSPERYGPEQLEALKVDLGSDARVAGQLQQRPAPALGNVFQRAWWDGKNRYDAQNEALMHKVVSRWLFLDTAYKDKETSDYSACAVIELWPDYRVGWRPLWNERLTFPYLLPRIEQTALAENADGKLSGVIVEDKGSGTTAIQSLQFGAPPWLSEKIQAFMPTGSKVYRAQQASLWCARDCVLIPHPSDAVPLLHEATEQLFTFPTAAHDDVVDTLSMGLIFLERVIAEGHRARMGYAA